MKSLKQLIVAVLLFSIQHSFAQVGIGTTTPDSSASLDITSTDSGVLIPRISLLDVTNVATPINSPATGLLIYNTNASVVGGNNEGFYYFNGTIWVKFSIIDGSISTDLKDIGVISAFPGPTYPNDMYLPLDGGAFNDVDYPEFATFITNLDSDVVTDNGNGTFTLADWNNNGIFLRGQGGNSGPLGALQNDATAQANNVLRTPVVTETTSTNGNHSHLYNRIITTQQRMENSSPFTPLDIIIGAEQSQSTSAGGSHNHTTTIPSQTIIGGDNETRPINRSITWVIKVKPSATSVNNLTINNFTDIGTDDQTISISGNTLTIEDGNSVTLPDNDTTYNGTDFALSNQTLPAGQFVTGISVAGTLIGATPIDSDNQNLTIPTLTGTTLNLGIQNGTGTNIDLSPLQDGTGTDNQNISGSGLSGTDLTIGIENGTSEVVDLSSLQDGIGTDNQNISGSGLSGTNLTIGIENGTNEIIDLSSIQDGIGTDNQTISLTGSTLSIQNGNSININGINTDNQTIDNFSFNNTTNQLTLEIENDGLPAQTVNLSSLNTNDADWFEEGTTSAPNSINDNIFTQGNVGIGDDTPDSKLNVEYTGNAEQAVIIDYNYTDTSNTAILPGGLTVNAVASTNRVLSSGLFYLSGTMSNGASSSSGVAVSNTVTSQSSVYGLGILVDGVSERSYGIDNIVTSSPSTINYGIQNTVSGGSNTNYGSRSVVSGTSNINYGIYADASGATTNWAGYFGSGNVYIQNELEVDGSLNYTDGNETVGYILESNATGDASWVDPSTVFTDLDEQTIDNFSFNTSTNELTLEIENDGIAAQTVDLSPLANDNDWHEEGSSTAPNNITDNMFHLGNVAIGKNTASYKLDVETLVDSRAINTRIGGTTTGTISGHYLLNNNSEDGEHYGINNNLTGSGDGIHHGIKNSISNGDGFQYGIANHIFGDGDGGHYGIANHLYGNGDGLHTGVYNNIAPNGTQDKTGVHNFMRLSTASNNADAYGVQNLLSEPITGSLGDFYGIHNTADGNGDGARYGMFNDFGGNGDGERYGSRSNISGSGTGAKYGSYNSISASAGGTHYGVYSSATNVNGYAGYFLGRFSIGSLTTNNYILPASRGTNGQVMVIDGTGNVTFSSIIEENSTASNGLTETGNDIRLGGTLIQDTNINYGNFDTRFNLDDTGDFIIQDDGTGVFLVNDAGNTVIGRDSYWRDETINGTLIGLLSDDGDDGRFRLYENGVASVDLDANTQFVFNEQGLDRDFRVESDGNDDMLFVDAGNNRVGIATNVPTASLHIEANSASATPQIKVTENNATDGGRISFNNTVETTNYWTLYGRSRDIAANSRFNLYTPSAGNVMIATGDGDIGIGTTPTFRLDVRDAQAGGYAAQIYNTSTNANADVLKIRVGRTTAPTSSNSFIAFFDGNGGTGTVRGRIQGDGSGTFYNTTSDRRLKTNITGITNALSLIDRIQPRRYEYKAKLGVNEYGFIAQELQPIYPQAVTGSPGSDVEKDPMMVDYGRLTPLLTAGIKELKNEVDILKKENQKLKAKLSKYESLEARLTALENTSVNPSANAIAETIKKE